MVNSAGKIELERKEAMKKRGLSSPDMGDALALALHDPLVSDWSIDDGGHHESEMQLPCIG